LDTSITYYVQDSTCGPSARTAVTVVVNPLPSASVTKPGGGTLTTGIFTSYQWLFNGRAISGATLPAYIADSSGNYQVVVTGSNGCSDTSAVFTFKTERISANGIAMNIRLYPNPGNGSFMLETQHCTGDEFTIYDVSGRVVLKELVKSGRQLINPRQAARGICFLSLTADGNVYTGKLVIAGE
jgi:hypothetical protein